MGSMLFLFFPGKGIWELLVLDLIVSSGVPGRGHPAGTLEEIFRWRERTDFYVFVIIGGAF